MGNKFVFCIFTKCNNNEICRRAKCTLVTCTQTTTKHRGILATVDECNPWLQSWELQILLTHGFRRGRLKEWKGIPQKTRNVITGEQPNSVRGKNGYRPYQINGSASKIKDYFIFGNRIFFLCENNSFRVAGTSNLFPPIPISSWFSMGILFQSKYSFKKTKKGLHTSDRRLIFASAIAKHAYALALQLNWIEHLTTDQEV